MAFRTLTELNTWLFRGFCYSGSMEDVFVGMICLVLASSTTGYTGVRVDRSWGKQLLLNQLMENTFSYILAQPQTAFQICLCS